MNILLVHNRYQLPGGEDTVFHNEQRLLEECGYRVRTYTRDNNEIRDYAVWRKMLLPFATIFNPRTYREIRRILRREQIDLVHVHNTLTLISPAVFYAAVREGVPVLQTLHNFRMQCPNGVFYRNGHICEDCVQKGLLCSVRYACYRSSRIQTAVAAWNTWFHRRTGIWRKVHFICLTEFNKKKLLELNTPSPANQCGKQIIDPEKVRVKPNFTWDPGIEPVPFEQREGFLYAGRLERVKGIDILLKTWAMMARESHAQIPRLTICGTGPLEDRCRAYIRKHHLEKEVTFTGQIAREELLQKMAGAMALIVPSRLYEGFPMTVTEALSTGTPAIVPAYGNAADIVNEGKSGLTFDGTAKALKDILQRIVDGEMVFQPGVVKEEYQKHYTPERNIEMMREIYLVCR